jgi:hypothetical protein
MSYDDTISHRLSDQSVVKHPILQHTILSSIFVVLYDITVVFPFPAYTFIFICCSLSPIVRWQHLLRELRRLSRLRLAEPTDIWAGMVTTHSNQVRLSFAPLCRE